MLALSLNLWHVEKSFGSLHFLYRCHFVMSFTKTFERCQQVNVNLCIFSCLFVILFILEQQGGIVDFRVVRKVQTYRSILIQIQNENKPSILSLSACHIQFEVVAELTSQSNWRKGVAHREQAIWEQGGVVEGLRDSQLGFERTEGDEGRGGQSVCGIQEMWWVAHH